MYGQLVPVGGGDMIPLLRTKLLVGRRESCDIVLRFSNVSAHHCELNLREGYWFVIDLKSRNGTKVNGVHVSERCVEPGDILAIAKHIYEFRYSPAELGANGPPPIESVQEEIMKKTLLERAGLDRKSKQQSLSSTGSPASDRPPQTPK